MLPPALAPARISAKFKNFFLFQGGGGGVMGWNNEARIESEQGNEQH